MGVHAAKKPRFDRRHGEPHGDFQLRPARTCANFAEHFGGNASELAEAAFWVGGIWRVVRGQVRRSAIGIHDKDKALGIGVIMDFLEDRWQNRFDGGPSTVA